MTVAWVAGVGCSLWAYYGLEAMEIPKRTYARMLHANFDYPFVKFAMTDDDRPMLMTELPAAALDRDELGRGITRLAVVADRLLDETANAVADRGMLPDWSGRAPRNRALFDAYRAEVEATMPAWEPARAAGAPARVAVTPDGSAVMGRRAPAPAVAPAGDPGHLAARRRRPPRGRCRVHAGDVRRPTTSGPAEGQIAVAVHVTFTNTTPDPEGQFSVFPEILLAVHDSATDVAATDAEGELAVEVAVNAEGANVATIALREGVRFEETVELELTYSLADGDDPQLRVRPSVVVFPAWGFGTTSEVTVTVPGGLRGPRRRRSVDRGRRAPRERPDRRSVAVAGAGHGHPAGRIHRRSTRRCRSPAAPPTSRCARSPTTRHGASEPSISSSARCRCSRTEIGLPYPHVGALIVTESVATDASGFGESPSAGNEILDRLRPAARSPRCTRSPTSGCRPSSSSRAGFAREWRATSPPASRPRSTCRSPFDPVAQATALQAAAFPLDTWADSADPTAEFFGHAASWAFVAELRAAVGDEALRAVLGRVAASIDPYAGADIEPPTDGGAPPQTPLTSRAFLDHLEAVTGADLAGRFRERVLSPADVELLEARAAARAAFDELVAAADGWGAPDPVRAAMTDWRFDEALPMIADAGTWLGRARRPPARDGGRRALRPRPAAAGVSVLRRRRGGVRRARGAGRRGAVLRHDGG